MTQKWAVVPWEQFVKKHEQEGEHDEEPSLTIESILLGIPKQGRRDAAAILHHIQNATGISWNDRGEILLQGTPIPKTHIADLIKYSLFSYKKWKPSGIKEFFRALAESNLPAGLIRNSDIRELLEHFKTPDITK